MSVSQQDYDEPMQGIEPAQTVIELEEQEPIVESTVLDISEYNPVAREVIPAVSSCE